ncbi:hypothetical protein AK812_SmicGene31903 [Symbiodinium microadriaticum]|uniref:Uncharacterized protein n=1 Tax=Symbiodinium microadriaticum TaxID=2951 RepID=A0A1Q9CVL0_SYMMI|nr:hypothetical protein AK812_SmicGene31903 [Symbiodinium microadriaticum]
MGRWQPSRETRGTVVQRCQNVQENMLRNLEEMRAYRQGIDEVVERRKTQARRFMEEFKPNPDTIALSELKPARHLDPVQPRPKEFQSMKDRISAMEDNAESNNEALGDHRKVLDCILAVRQAAEQSRGLQKVSGSEALKNAANQVVEEEAEPEGIGVNEKCREIQRNSRWMGTAMQKAAVSKARVDDAKDKRRQQDMDLRAEAEAGSQAATEDASLRPQSASISKPGMAQLGDPKRGGHRPVSASTTWPSRPASSMSRPKSALSQGTSRRSSRPPSVNSLTARFKNLQETVERNQETLKSHRHGLEMVVKSRQDRVQRLADELLSSIKTMYEQREAERNK